MAYEHKDFTNKNVELRLNKRMIHAINKKFNKLATINGIVEGKRWNVEAFTDCLYTFYEPFSSHDCSTRKIPMKNHLIPIVDAYLQHHIVSICIHIYI